MQMLSPKYTILIATKLLGDISITIFAMLSTTNKNAFSVVLKL